MIEGRKQGKVNKELRVGVCAHSFKLMIQGNGDVLILTYRSGQLNLFIF